MKAHARVLVALAAVMPLLAGCGKPAQKEAPAPAAPTAETLTQDMIIVALSDPDESWVALGSRIDKDVWSKTIDRGTAVAGTSRLSAAAALGTQSVNAMAASLVGDSAAAEKLAASVKDLATSLNVYTPEIEELIGKINKDLKESDAAKKDAAVRKDLNLLRMQLVRALDSMGNGAESAILLFGAWVESVRISSAALGAQYDAQSSGALIRGLEADYFASKFLTLSKVSPLFESLVPGIRAISAAMTPTDHRLSAAAVKTINAEAAKLSAILKK